VKNRFGDIIVQIFAHSDIIHPHFHPVSIHQTVILLSNRKIAVKQLAASCNRTRAAVYRIKAG